MRLGNASPKGAYVIAASMMGNTLARTVMLEHSRKVVRKLVTGYVGVLIIATLPVPIFGVFCYVLTQTMWSNGSGNAVTAAVMYGLAMWLVLSVNSIGWLNAVIYYRHFRPSSPAPASPDCAPPTNAINRSRANSLNLRRSRHSHTPTSGSTFVSNASGVSGGGGGGSGGGSSDDAFYDSGLNSTFPPTPPLPHRTSLPGSIHSAISSPGAASDRRGKSLDIHSRPAFLESDPSIFSSDPLPALPSTTRSRGKSLELHRPSLSLGSLSNIGLGLGIARERTSSTGSSSNSTSNNNNNNTGAFAIGAPRRKRASSSAKSMSLNSPGSPSSAFERDKEFPRGNDGRGFQTPHHKLIASSPTSSSPSSPFSNDGSGSNGSGSAVGGTTGDTVVVEMSRRQRRSTMDSDNVHMHDYQYLNRQYEDEIIPGGSSTSVVNSNAPTPLPRSRPASVISGNGVSGASANNAGLDRPLSFAVAPPSRRGGATAGGKVYGRNSRSSVGSLQQQGGNQSKSYPYMQERLEVGVLKEEKEEEEEEEEEEGQKIEPIASEQEETQMEREQNTDLDSTPHLSTRFSVSPLFPTLGFPSSSISTSPIDEPLTEIDRDRASKAELRLSLSLSVPPTDQTPLRLTPTMESNRDSTTSASTLGITPQESASQHHLEETSSSKVDSVDESNYENKKRISFLEREDQSIGDPITTNFNLPGSPTLRNKRLSMAAGGGGSQRPVSQLLYSPEELRMLQQASKRSSVFDTFNDSNKNTNSNNRDDVDVAAQQRREGEVVVEELGGVGRQFVVLEDVLQRRSVIAAITGGPRGNEVSGVSTSPLQVISEMEADPAEEAEDAPQTETNEGEMMTQPDPYATGVQSGTVTATTTIDTESDLINSYAGFAVQQAEAENGEGSEGFADHLGSTWILDLVGENEGSVSRSSSINEHRGPSTEESRKADDPAVAKSSADDSEERVPVSRASSSASRGTRNVSRNNSLISRDTPALTIASSAAPSPSPTATNEGNEYLGAPTTESSSGDGGKREQGVLDDKSISREQGEVPTPTVTASQLGNETGTGGNGDQAKSVAESGKGIRDRVKLFESFANQ
ncbi:hypothetical protein HK102_002990 [Quaeritorhiza haematococci]|nr:hypothetical protein HK102_002990 [Quaeritorhiza haematococci]